MEKDLAILLTDGSMESAVLCATARQKHELILADASTPGEEGAREAVQKQIEYLRPRQTHSVQSAAQVLIEDAAGLLRWTALLAAAAPLVRVHRATALYVPLRSDPASGEYARTAEFLQIWEELYRDGLALGPVKLLAPLLEMESWQVADLAQQVHAPLTPAHGEIEHEAFVRAGRAKP